MENRGLTFTGFLVIIVILGILAAAIIKNVSETPPRKHREIIKEAKALVDNCKDVQEVDKIIIKGNCIVWDKESDSYSPVHSMLRKSMKAKSSDSRLTIFMVMKQRDVLVGRYSISKQPGYKRYVDVYVIYWPEKQVAGMHSVLSNSPRQTRPVQSNPEYGNSSIPVASWINSLPILMRENRQPEQ
jgi:Tfp pilus assembly protein PilE